MLVATKGEHFSKRQLRESSPCSSSHKVTSPLSRKTSHQECCKCSQRVGEIHGILARKHHIRGTTTFMGTALPASLESIVS